MDSKLCNMDCQQYLTECEKVRCIIADPPDNVGLSYGSYNDSMSPAVYNNWLELLILNSMLKCDIMWLSYNQKHDLVVSSIVERIVRTRHRWDVRKIIWTYTFGAYLGDRLTSCYRPILCISSPGFKPNLDAIRVISERQLMGDSRAAGMKVPGDVWDFPRVVGNSPERRGWHPTQHPVKLYERMIGYSAGVRDTVVDLFAGTGTLFRTSNVCSAKIGIEIDPVYCKNILADNSSVVLARSN